VIMTPDTVSISKASEPKEGLKCLLRARSIIIRTYSPGCIIMYSNVFHYRQIESFGGFFKTGLSELAVETGSSWSALLPDLVDSLNNRLDENSKLTPLQCYSPDGYQEQLRSYLESNGHLQFAYYRPSKSLHPQLGKSFFKFKPKEKVLVDMTGYKPELRGFFPKISEARHVIWENGIIQ